MYPDDHLIWCSKVDSGPRNAYHPLVARISQHALLPGGAWSGGVPGLGGPGPGRVCSKGGLLPGGAWSQGGAWSRGVCSGGGVPASSLGVFQHAMEQPPSPTLTESQTRVKT